MTFVERITALVDADLAQSGLLDAVKTPDDLRVLNLHRRMLIENSVFMAKFGLIPKP